MSNLKPIDPRDPSERRWLDALLPPDWIEERRQLRAALDFRAATPVEVHAGDALDIVPRLLSEVADPVCVFHAHCLYQWSLPLHLAFETILREASHGRAIHRLGMEYADRRLSPLPGPTGYEDDPVLTYEITHSVYRDGEHHARRLAIYDGFGKVAVWLPAGPRTQVGATHRFGTNGVREP